MSSSTLVETVSINYEDFSESFLTCSTCLCAYDQAVHRPKLLSCSHTVCHSCLEQIVNLPPAVDTGNFRCPICREIFPVPRGGVPTLPPSFLVNQLIDLMQRQRRDVVPKCGAHPAEELLFCETCSTVFCPQCADPGASTSTGACHNHTIVPFSIAIKRMSEILLYKANQCVKNLNRAAANVQREMNDLDKNVDQILDEVNASFQELSQMLDSRRREMVDVVRKTRDEKRRVLQEQLGIIQAETAKVEQDCNGLQYQVEVRNITRKIGELNEKLDTTLTLVEPRENAFLRYDSTTEEVLKGIQQALAHFGSLSVSQTFPPLCIASAQPASVFLESEVIVTTIDYNGQYRTTGGDPVQATLTCVENDVILASSLGVTTADNQDGTYALHYRAPVPGRYTMTIRIFGRPIKSSPVEVQVSPHHIPVWQFGSLGTEAHCLCQPVKVSCAPDGHVFVLDTGNNRVKVLSEDGLLVRHLNGEGLMQQSAIGMALLPAPVRGLLTLNWRSRSVTEWALDGQVGREQKCFSFSEFIEPIDLAVDSRGRILVADNGAKKIFVFDPLSRPLFSFPIRNGAAETLKSATLPSSNRMSSSNHVTPQAANHVTCVAVGMNDDILVASGPGVQLYDCTGKFVRHIAVSPTNHGGTLIQGANKRPPSLSCRTWVGGLAVDCETGTILTAVTERNRSFISVSQYKGELKFTLDSHGAKLKRPSGLCVAPDRIHCLVADLGNHSIKRYRFK